jgi:hypothetical protein
MAQTRFWTGPPLGQSPGPGPVPWSWTGPLVRDRSAATACADRRNPRRPGDPQRLNAVRRPGGAERGTFRAHRHLVDGPVRLAREAGAATGVAWRRLRPMRAAGRLRACARRGCEYPGLVTRRVRGCCDAGRRPGRRCDRAPTRLVRQVKTAGYHMARQPGSERLTAGAVGQLFTMPPDATTPG